MTISEPPEDSKPKIPDSIKPLENNNVQKIVIDVKAAEQSDTNVKKRPKVEKKVKREIALVLEPTPKKCHGFVGFANLPNQVYK